MTEQVNDGNSIQILRNSPDIDFYISVNKRLVPCSTKKYHTGFIVEGNDQILFGDYGDYVNVFDGGFKITKQEYDN